MNLCEELKCSLLIVSDFVRFHSGRNSQSPALGETLVVFFKANFFLRRSYQQRALICDILAVRADAFIVRAE